MSREVLYSFAYLDRKVGPFFDAVGVQSIAALNADELALAERLFDVISVTANVDGEMDRPDKLYPSFQFGPQGEFLPGLREVAYILWPASRTNGWYLPLWLRTRCEAFEGRTPAEILRVGLLGPVFDQAQENIESYIALQPSAAADEPSVHGAD